MLKSQVASLQVERTFAPEACPYETVIIDVTHRCNMTCLNCYIPNRTIPDLDAEWLCGILDRLPRGTFVRFAGGEPTLHADLPRLTHEVRKRRLHPVLVTNGLKLADRAYVRELKRAGMRLVYLSFSGGFDDDLYESIDNMRCAGRKAAALENLTAENMFTSIGMIIVRGVNEPEAARVWRNVETRRAVREFHLRSVGAMGRHMATTPLSLDEMLSVFGDAANVDPGMISRHERTLYSHDFRFNRVRVQLTVWPDLGSVTRGRLTPEGTIAPFMEHVVANEGGY